MKPNAIFNQARALKNETLRRLRKPRHCVVFSEADIDLAAPETTRLGKVQRVTNVFTALQP